MTELRLKYNFPATDSNLGWEQESLPLGNGWLGANVFGIVERERIQITENSLANPPEFGGMNNFAELYFKFDHQGYTNYERILSLDESKAYVSYEHNGIKYLREYFTTYPDKVLAVRLTASEPASISFNACPEIPYVKPYASKKGDGGGKKGRIKAKGNTITLSGRLNYYNVRFEGQLRIFATGGSITADEKTVSVANADSVVIIFGCGTNYVLCPNVFNEEDPKKKLPDVDPHGKVQKILDNACKKSFDELYEAHIRDYRRFFNRVSLEFTDKCDNRYTDEMLKAYGEGEPNPYLEQLYFQFGRYLLISSSREGCLPPNLQGVWNVYDRAPWTAGYWHNINIQMNYWPAFNTNLAELFKSYSDFNEALRERASYWAADYIKRANPDAYTDAPGECGWIISTPCWPYKTVGLGEHCGPGNGGLTTKMFWDAYEFTGDRELLKKTVFPALYTMSKFLTKTVTDYDGDLLCKFGNSPEQEPIEGYEGFDTIGAPFDQQTIRENGHDMLKAAEILGKNDKLIRLQKQQLPHYNPVVVGWSGQIKEYLEENFYGQFGEYKHRHISHLFALYPGTMINRDTPAWLDAAKVSLRERGDRSKGWALAHRLNARARTGDAKVSYKLLHNLIGQMTYKNLWDAHPPFQIDGNFGGTAGIAEMLLQSHEKHIILLPALPDAWKKSGKFSGLVARGAFEFAAEWENGFLTNVRIKSKKGNECRLCYGNIALADIRDGKGNKVDFIKENNDHITFSTTENGEYIISGIIPKIVPDEPTELSADKNTMTVRWQTIPEVTYNVYRAEDNDAVYTKVAENLSAGEYTDTECDFSAHEIVTYKVTAVNCHGNESDGPTVTLNHATKRQIELYNRFVHHIF